MHNFLVTTSHGLEQLLEEELRSMLSERDFFNRPGQVGFSGELSDIYHVCLWSRIANRALLQLNLANGASGDELYQLASQINWGSHLSADQTFAVDFIGTNRFIKNSQFGAVRIKDAVVDHFQDLYGQRPNVDKQSPDIRIQGRIHRDKLAVYLDLSGASLHQRGYRERAGLAPIKENVAFAMLMRSGWTKSPEKPIYDPMCGTGTILIEAAQFASRIAPGLAREKWGFEFWKGHDSDVWQGKIEEANSSKQSISTRFVGNDIDANVIEIATENAEIAGVDNLIEYHHGNAIDFIPAIESPGFVISNTPFGERLSEMTELLPLFKSFGFHLKNHFKDWCISLLTSNRDMLRQLKLVAKKEYKIVNGNIECQLVNYVLDEKNCQINEKEQATESAIGNRLKKNLKKLQRWLKTQDTDCYRIYDADLPEYNVAIDRYGDWVVVQEYAAPKEIPQHKTTARLQEVLIAIPQVLDISHSKIVMKVREKQKGKAQYQKLDKKHEEITVHENGASFLVNLQDYLDTGLFLDHRLTRQKVRDMSKGKRVLNLFAYTGSVSVFAALGGAKSVTTVDMSNTYLQWAKKNFEANKIKGYHQFVKADCVKWVATNDKFYDLIFVDPPSFSNSKSMDDSWDVQRDHVHFLQSVRKRLNPGGKIIFSNNLRHFKLDPDLAEKLQLSITEITKETIPLDFERNKRIHHCWLLEDTNG